MSLEGEQSSRLRAFLFDVEFSDPYPVVPWESGKARFWAFHFSMALLVAAVEMWESQLRFPRAVDSEVNLPLVFLGVHCPSFPRPSFTPSSSVGFRQITSVSPLASSAPRPYHFPPRLFSLGLLASCPPAGVAPDPAAAAGSPTA